VAKTIPIYENKSNSKDIENYRPNYILWIFMQKQKLIYQERINTDSKETGI
jgi:hypothetical protein